jgi:hypothetical protein
MYYVLCIHDIPSEFYMKLGIIKKIKNLTVIRNICDRNILKHVFPFVSSLLFGTEQMPFFSRIRKMPLFFSAIRVYNLRPCLLVFLAKTA